MISKWDTQARRGYVAFRKLNNFHATGWAIGGTYSDDDDDDDGDDGDYDDDDDDDEDEDEDDDDDDDGDGDGDGDDDDDDDDDDWFCMMTMTTACFPIFASIYWSSITSPNHCLAI